MKIAETSFKDLAKFHQPNPVIRLFPLKLGTEEYYFTDLRNHFKILRR